MKELRRIPSAVLLPDRLSALAAEVLARCDALARHSLDPGRVNRPSYTGPMLEVHREVGGYLADAGLHVRVDPVGNLFGRREPVASGGKLLLLGSHLDTVVDAGRYDGILGVLLGIAVAKALRDVELPFGLEVVGFSDEEGVRFSTAYLGSRALVGKLDRSILERRDADGVSLYDAMVACGFEPDRVREALYPPERLRGYVEAHIEQGPILEARGVALGVVDAIAAQERIRLRFTGQAGHAGTVPVEARRDAGVVAARFVLRARAQAEAVDGLRATVGWLELEPNVRNVIPARARLVLDIRHRDDAVLAAAVAELLGDAERLAREGGCNCEIEQRDAEPAVPMDRGLRDGLVQALEAAGHEPIMLPSGAGHDAVMISEIAPVAMLFLRSPGGLSHHPDEAVLPADVQAALEVLVRFVGGLGGVV